MELLTDPHAWVALVTLTALEIVLGIDNIIFISILVGRLPAGQRRRARRIGLSLAMVSRIALLLSIAWLMTWIQPLITLAGNEISGRDLVLIGGGLFLLWKSVREIHDALEGLEEGAHSSHAGAATFGAVIAQIAIIDIIFSLDSVITAVGLVDEVPVMIVAIVVAVLAMMAAAEPIGDFVDTHPTIRMLALAFLVLVGVVLMVEGLGVHVPKGYVYFAMAFSVGVEMLNIRARRLAGKPLRLRKSRSRRRKGG